MKTKITTLLLVLLLVTICGISALANEAETKITVEELQAKVAELEERISILEELLLEADEAEEQSQQSDMVQTQRDNINVKIYENEYFSVTIDCIQPHEIRFIVANKTDVDLTIMIKELFLDGVNYHSSDSMWDIYAGESGELYYSNYDVDLDLNTTTISGTFELIDDGGIYGGGYYELPFEEVILN
ncbi:MAG: hypothetical protein Q4E91_06095 [Lachnospiraceae bacterium]|nr:hypothetical protein [Lachnospiraceae bacterium]